MRAMGWLPDLAMGDWARRGRGSDGNNSVGEGGVVVGVWALGKGLGRADLAHWGSSPGSGHGRGCQFPRGGRRFARGGWFSSEVRFTILNWVSPSHLRQVPADHRVTRHDDMTLALLTRSLGLKLSSLRWSGSMDNHPHPPPRLSSRKLIILSQLGFVPILLQTPVIFDLLNGYENLLCNDDRTDLRGNRRIGPRIDRFIVGECSGSIVAAAEGDGRGGSLRRELQFSGEGVGSIGEGESLRASMNGASSSSLFCRSVEVGRSIDGSERGVVGANA
ncbi:hypothetical protein TIFTF001_027442 [Ficus carica]|uniref:Uncharacterized protein n=1 Tax=Ficus carica TaxID=3494 RepID=A0AA88IYJ3_FICCA|nr:hypothetical protein TIFTF001_027442 [Ficus carica]